LTWDITVVSTLAASYLHASSLRAGATAELAASQKEAKYSCLPRSLLFQPIAFKTLGPLDPSALDFLGELGQRLSAATGDVCETAYLFQRLSVVIQRYNSVLSYESFGDLDLESDL